MIDNDKGIWILINNNFNGFFNYNQGLRLLNYF